MKEAVSGYETTIVFRPEATDDGRKNYLEKLRGVIQTHGGQLLATEEWGRRKLAYPIKKESRGYYVYFLYSGNNQLVNDLERNLRINEQIIRFLTVGLGTDFDPASYKVKPTVNAQNTQNAHKEEREVSDAV